MVTEIGTSVKRPVRRGQSFPLIRTLVFTGEAANPWRCDNCLTNPQRAKVKPATEVVPDGYPRPDCCRKCGVELY